MKLKRTLQRIKCDPIRLYEGTGAEVSLNIKAVRIA